MACSPSSVSRICLTEGGEHLEIHQSRQFGTGILYWGRAGCFSKRLATVEPPVWACRSQLPWICKKRAFSILLWYYSRITRVA